MNRLMWTALLSMGGIWAQQAAPPPRRYISQIASGGGWKTTITLFNPTSGPNAVHVLFQSSDGSQLAMPLIVTQGGSRAESTSSEVSRTIQPLSTLVIESEAPATSSTLTGWAEVTSARRILGSAIFRQRSPDTGLNVEAVAPLDYSAVASLVIPFDNGQGAATGVALVNPTDSMANVVVRSRNENGIELHLSEFVLPAKGHAAVVISERFPSLAGLRGTIEFLTTITDRLTGLGLRFDGSGGFTSIPVLHLAESLASHLKPSTEVPDSTGNRHLSPVS